MSEIRFAWRILRRAPLLTAVVILSLGLGIGANTAISSLLYQVVLRPLPVVKPNELVKFRVSDRRTGHTSADNAGSDLETFSYLMFRHLEKEAKGIQGLAGFRLVSANLSYRSQTTDGLALPVSGDYFALLGVKPQVGRLLTTSDDKPGAGQPYAVLAYDYWHTRMGGQTEILNQPLRINGKVFTIVGVAQKGFQGTTFGDSPSVFVPMALKPSLTPTWDGTDKWNDHWLYLFARALPGASLAQTEAAMAGSYASGIAEQLTATAELSARQRERLSASRLLARDGRYGHSRPRESAATPLLILMAATGLVLLIAIANTANLLLARAAQRSKELAIRTALGARRGKLVLQLLTEAMMLSIAGGLAGLLFAPWTVALLVTGFDPDLATQLRTDVDGPILGFAFVLSLLTGLLCGLYPAWQASRATVNETLRSQSNNASASSGAARVRRILVCALVTISAILLIPTGLFLKSMVNLLQVNLGMETHHVVTFHIRPELNGYQPPASRALFQRAEEQLRSIPGVKSATTSMLTLLADNDWSATLSVEGYGSDAQTDTEAKINMVGPEFFQGLAIPVLAGREFLQRDDLNAPKVAVVNETFARYFFGQRNAIGRKLAMKSGVSKFDIEIVGVVRDSHYSGVKQESVRLLYLPWMQKADVGAMAFYVAATLPEAQIIPQVRRVMKGLDPDLPLEELRTLEEQVSDNIRSDKMVLQLTGAFAVLATLLAMLGLYGVMAFSVTRRTREIGIRMALGAPLPSIRALVMRELLVILLAGLACGVPAALALSRLTESLLFGVRAFDAVVLVSAVLALCIAAFGAGYVPSRRALRVDPITALRYD